MKKVNNLLKKTIIFTLFSLSCSSFAQTPTYTCIAKNDSLLNSKVYQFEVYIYRTGATALYLNNYQLTFFISNYAAIINGGTLTTSYIAGTSQLAGFAPSGMISISGYPAYLKVAGPSASSNGILIPTTGLRIGRFQIVNSVDFGQSNLNLVWNNAPPSLTNIKAIVPPAPTGPQNDITTFINHSTSLFDPLLNIAVTAYNMTGGGNYCQGDPGSAIGLDNSQTGVLYLLKNNGTPVGAYVPGIGAALSFGIQAAGIYTCTAYRQATYLSNTMTGSITFLAETPGLWVGITNDWNTASNWGVCGLPTSNSDVIIPTTPTGGNFPQVNSNGTAVCKNITIQSGASLTVNAGKDLSVYGDWTNNGTNIVGTGTVIFSGSSAQAISGSTRFESLTINSSNTVTLNNNTELNGILTPTAGTFNSNGKLTMRSTASQTALISGTGSGSVTGNVTLQRYMANKQGYHYYSSPFNAAAITEFNNELGTVISGNPYVGNDTTQTVSPFPNFFMYDETYAFPTMSLGWVGAGATMAALKGYAVNFGNSSTPITTDITGVVNNGPYSLSVTKTTTTNTFADGWNLVGNPYPSPIDWKAGSGWTKTNVNDAIYCFIANSQYTGIYSSFVNNIGANGGTRYIPAMQGFYIKATAAGTLGVTNSVRTANLNPSFFKLTTTTADPLLRLKGSPVLQDSLGDETVVYFESLATSSFDGDFDAYKIANNASTYPNIFTRDFSGNLLSINGLSPLTTTDVIVPLGFTTKTSGNYKISASEILNFDPSLHIYLEDTQNSIYQDLTTNPEYTFSINANDPIYRFYVRFSYSVVTGISTNEGSNINAYTQEHDLFINSNLTDNNATVTVFNTLGQIVIDKEQIKSGTSHYRLENAGCYIISIVSNNQSYQQKIVIQ